MKKFKARVATAKHSSTHEPGTMTTRALIQILKTFQPDSTVSLCFWNGEATEVAELSHVADNNGPSFYTKDWDGPRRYVTTKW